MFSLVFSILFPIVIILALVIGLSIFFVTLKKQKSSTRGTLLFELDIRSRRIKPYYHVSTNIISKHIFNRIQTGAWIPLSELTGRFIGSPGEKKFRNIFVKALKDDEVSTKFTTSQVIKRERVSFKIKINRIDDTNSHILNLTWGQSLLAEDAKRRKDFTKVELANESSQYKGFIAFALDSNIPNIENIFTKQIEKTFRFYQPEIFFAKGFACIPIFGRDEKRTQKRMNRYIKIIQGKGYVLGLNRITFGSAQILSKDVNTPKRVNAILKTLDFLVNLSIRYKEDFVKRDSEHFTIEEYQAFIEAAQVFRLALRSGDIKSVPISVRKYKSKRKIIEYVVPTIEDIPDDILVAILENDSDRSKLVDAHAKNISVENKLSKPSLFDVNAEWIIKNKSKIFLKKAIYVVNFPRTITKEHIDTISSLREKGFIFALRIKEYSEQVSTLVINIKPQFIVIDRTLASVATPSSYIQLISIKRIAMHENIKLIFENPSLNIEQEWIEKIGLDFYYEF